METETFPIKLTNEILSFLSFTPLIKSISSYILKVSGKCRGQNIKSSFIKLFHFSSLFLKMPTGKHCARY